MKVKLLTSTLKSDESSPAHEKQVTVASTSEERAAAF
jgi:hypothetical protein